MVSVAIGRAVRRETLLFPRAVDEFSLRDSRRSILPVDVMAEKRDPLTRGPSAKAAVKLFF